MAINDALVHAQVRCASGKLLSTACSCTFVDAANEALGLARAAGGRPFRLSAMARSKGGFRLAIAECADIKEGADAFDLDCSRVSLRLMPDFGGAALWTPAGVCSALMAEDFPGADPDLVEGLAERVDRWQGFFERGCPIDADGSSGYAFDWTGFWSEAAALALRSLAVLPVPLHVETCYEAEASGVPAALWLPDWGWQSPAEEAACMALSRLDEDGFCECLGKGARQRGQRDMPWAVYCAHMGLGRALSELARVSSAEARVKSAWGCAPAHAALRSGSVAAVAACVGAGLASSPLPNGLRAVEILADSARADGADAALACLGAWAGAGGDLSLSGAPEAWMPKASMDVYERAAALEASRSCRSLLDAECQTPRASRSGSFRV